MLQLFQNNFVGLINYWMKEILLNLGIYKNANIYIARHTFSTALKRSSASAEFIQEALEHTDIKITESYLDSFDRERYYLYFFVQIHSYFCLFQRKIDE
jgi:integrase